MKMGMCEGLWQSGTRCCQLHWVWGGEGERSCVWVGPRPRVPLRMRKQPRNLPKIKNILEEAETLQAACVVSLYALNCPHSSQATWLHTCKEVEAQGWLLKVHRVWIWIWTQAYVPSPFYLSQPLMMYCTSVSISRRLCTYLGNCSYPAVVKSNFKELWMDCPCDRWWFHTPFPEGLLDQHVHNGTISCRSASHCGFTVWGESFLEWLLGCCPAIIRLYKPWDELHSVFVEGLCCLKRETVR